MLQREIALLGGVLGEGAYAIELATGGATGRFEGRLGRLGDRMVLSVWPTPRADELPQPYGDLLIAAHLNLVLEIGPDEVRTWTIDPDSLLAALEADRVRLTHRRAGDRLVLLDETEELRSALGPHLGSAGSLAEPRRWRRVEPAASLLPEEVPLSAAAGPRPGTARDELHRPADPAADAPRDGSAAAASSREPRAPASGTGLVGRSYRFPFDAL